MTAHTPGPWEVAGHRQVTSPAGIICEVFSHMGIAEADANERLIAVAPDLLAALEWIAKQPQGYMYAEIRGAACNAIAKALSRESA